MILAVLKIYYKMSTNNIHKCDIHKETFIFLKSLLRHRRHKNILKNLKSIIKFVHKQQNFTKQDLIDQFNLSYVTVTNYLRLLDQLKLYKIKKILPDEIKNTTKQYTYTKSIILQEALFFLEQGCVCPILLADKDIFNNMHDFVNQRVVEIYSQRKNVG